MNRRTLLKSAGATAIALPASGIIMPRKTLASGGTASASYFNGWGWLRNRGMPSNWPTSRYGFQSVWYRSDWTEASASTLVLSTDGSSNNHGFLLLQYAGGHDYLSFGIGPGSGGGSIQGRVSNNTFYDANAIPLPHDVYYHNILLAYDTRGNITFNPGGSYGTVDQTVIKIYYDNVPMNVRVQSYPGDGYYTPYDVVGPGTRWWVGNSPDGQFYVGDIACISMISGVDIYSSIIDDPEFRAQFIRPADGGGYWAARMATSGVIPYGEEILKCQMHLAGQPDRFPGNYAAGSPGYYGIGYTDTSPSSMFTVVGSPLQESDTDPFEPGSPF